MVVWESHHGLQRPSLDPQTTLPLHRIMDHFPTNIQTFFSTASINSPGSVSSKPEDIWLTDVATVPLTLLNAINYHANHLQLSQT